MRILMISPHPTYTPRGTPISVLNRCRALCALGHQIDLVTYGIGADVSVPGLTWLRAPVPGITSVKIGPSAKKIPLDLAVFVKATVLAIRGRRRYDVVHSHEEAGMVGAALSRTLGIPHVYDMGNDLSVVMRNYGFSARNVLTRIMVGAETATIRGSDSVIAHFPSIAARVREVDGGRIPATVVVNVPIEAPASPTQVASFRERWSPDGLPIALYTGTLEPYQGVPALVEAADLVRRRGVGCRLVVVGGTDTQQHDLSALVSRAESAGVVTIAGAVAQDDIRSCLAAADILVSPRDRGSNTPLKIFSYMHAGKPLLATRIEGHRQVLDDDSACLVEPTAAALADGLCETLRDPGRAAERASMARAIAERRYSLVDYLREVAEAYVPVGGTSASAADLAQARDALSGSLIRAAG